MNWIGNYVIKKMICVLKMRNLNKREFNLDGLTLVLMFFGVLVGATLCYTIPECDAYSFSSSKAWATSRSNGNWLMDFDFDYDTHHM